MHVKLRGKIAVGKFRKKPLVVDAIRYGKDEDGRWYPGCVQRVALFMLGRKLDSNPTIETILSVLRPTTEWNPPECGDLEMFDGVAHMKWLPLVPGDWVIKGLQGEFYPCKADIFDQTYEKMGD